MLRSIIDYLRRTATRIQRAYRRFALPRLYEVGDGVIFTGTPAFHEILDATDDYNDAVARGLPSLQLTDMTDEEFHTWANGDYKGPPYSAVCLNGASDERIHVALYGKETD